jgi:hypothetical protein
MTQYIDQTLSILDKAYFWRLFVDGAKQKNTPETKVAEVKYAANYFVGGEFPIGFLFAETCHLNKKEYIEYYSKKASELNATDPLESMPLIAEEAVDLQTIS